MRLPFVKQTAVALAGLVASAGLAACSSASGNEDAVRSEMLTSTARRCSVRMVQVEP